MSRFVLVGAGLHGCALGWELARRGADVVLVERGVPGAEASTAAAGILAPTVEAWAHGGALLLGKQSLATYPTWVAAVSDASGTRVDIHLTGVRVVGEKGPPGACEVDGDWIVEGEGWVDPKDLMPAVQGAAVAAGVRFVRGEVVEVRADRARVDGVGWVDGTAVICAGAWTARVPGLASIPVRPVRGQVIALRPRGLGPRTVVYGAGGYLVPRADGRVLVGATMEEVGFERGVTPDGIAAMWRVARTLCPDLADAELLDAWSGFRPGTPDGLPLLGKYGDLWIASGHHRNGILLAPFTAMAMAAALLEGVALPEELAPGRFEGGGIEAR